MEGKRLNALMLTYSIIGGIIGFAIGEYMIVKTSYRLPTEVLVGLYFGILALCVGIMCLLAEIKSPRLNGYAWKNRYLGYSWKYLIPCTLGILFLSGALLQFIYGLSIEKKNINDVVLLVDISQSMEVTDPDNLRFEAVNELMGKMTEDNRIGVFVFNDNPIIVKPMAYATDATKAHVANSLKNYSSAFGKTNIEASLNESLSHIKDNSGADRTAMVILLSDGGDTYNLASTLDKTLSPYRDEGIPIYTVGMRGSDVKMLKSISRKTGGNYYKVSDAKHLGNIFSRIYQNKNLRLLIGERTGKAMTSTVYAIMRILFITILGAFLGFGVGLMFDNKYLAKSLTLGGIASGLISGLILEIGFLRVPWFESYIRLVFCVIISSIFTLFTLVVPVAVDEGISQGKTYGYGNKSKLINKSNKFGNKQKADGQRSFGGLEQ